MINKLKEASSLDVISRYLSRTKVLRKILDVLLICLIMLVFGYATGKLKLPVIELKPHTVEASLDRTREVQKVLDVFQSSNKHSFVGHFIYHNGQSSLNGSFAFIKYSLMEYSRDYGVLVNPMRWKDLPIQMDIQMSLKLQHNGCYFKLITYEDSQFVEYRELGTTQIVACPIFDRNNNLASFVLVGSRSLIDIEQVKVLSKEVSALQRYTK